MRNAKSKKYVVGSMVGLLLGLVGLANGVHFFAIDGIGSGYGWLNTILGLCACTFNHINLQRELAVSKRPVRLDH